MNRYKRKLVKRFILSFKKKAYILLNKKESKMSKLINYISKLQISLIKAKNSDVNNLDLPERIVLLENKIKCLIKLLSRTKSAKELVYYNRKTIQQLKYSVYLKNYRKNLAISYVPLRYSTNYTILSW